MCSCTLVALEVCRIPHDNPWAEIKVLHDDVQQLLLALLGGSIVEYGHRQWMGDSNSVGHLKQSPQRLFIQADLFPTWW